jgi:uncharacterized tellurite resistance protein B-like protein
MGETNVKEIQFSHMYVTCWIMSIDGDVSNEEVLSSLPLLSGALDMEQAELVPLLDHIFNNFLSAGDDEVKAVLGNSLILLSEHLSHEELERLYTDYDSIVQSDGVHPAEDIALKLIRKTWGISDEHHRIIRTKAFKIGVKMGKSGCLIWLFPLPFFLSQAIL